MAIDSNVLTKDDIAVTLHDFVVLPDDEFKQYMEDAFFDKAVEQLTVGNDYFIQPFHWNFGAGAVFHSKDMTDLQVAVLYEEEAMPEQWGQTIVDEVLRQFHDMRILPILDANTNEIVGEMVAYKED